MEEEKPKIIIVVGPTASGKSSLAVNLAKHFDGEVISADSRQVYRGLDIGSAKVNETEMEGIPHHLLDVADVNTVYTASDFKRDATTMITDMVKRKKLPIIAGGTFFYIDYLLNRISVPKVAPNPELRELLEQKSTAELLTRLKKKDPRRASEIDPNNRRRIIRALEIIHELEYVPDLEASASPYDTLVVGAKIDPTKLKDKFRVRASDWLSRGFQTEVEDLLKAGVSRGRLQEIGFEYQLILELNDGLINQEKFIEKFVQKNWQYAKRQMTWLKRDQSIRWFRNDDPEIFTTIENFLHNWPTAVFSLVLSPQIVYERNNLYIWS